MVFIAGFLGAFCGSFVAVGTMFVWYTWIRVRETRLASAQVTAAIDRAREAGLTVTYDGQEVN